MKAHHLLHQYGHGKDVCKAGVHNLMGLGATLSYCSNSGSHNNMFAGVHNLLDRGPYSHIVLTQGDAIICLPHSIQKAITPYSYLFNSTILGYIS